MMFIRPARPTVTAATRPQGHPLLRGLLRRAAGAAEWTQGEEPEREREREREEWERTGWGEGAAGAAGTDGVEGAADAIADLEGDAQVWEMGAREGGTERTAGAAEPQATPAGPFPEAALPDAAPSDGANTPGAAEGTPTAQPGLAAELTQLAALAREGLLTPQEFTTAKSKLLRG
ncbi:hypothetical protein [Streptomyces sp. Isolate_45]|uniref:hypothetical protein n=1 Tax=unclassified Streptomyces TaxID=2593676 RepID=UPI0024819D92|nr:hypothetical protein [Streptomyces sp. Isolate_45]MDA5282664.1 hypothetical protein [Streptomyces sp. Isolate_45]